jgi:hypothetical protein
MQAFIFSQTALIQSSYDLANLLPRERVVQIGLNVNRFNLVARVAGEGSGNKN